MGKGRRSEPPQLFSAARVCVAAPSPPREGAPPACSGASTPTAVRAFDQCAYLCVQLGGGSVKQIRPECVCAPLESDPAMI